MANNLFFEYIKWHFYEMPEEILKGWKNYLKFGNYFFSITLLLKSLFSPWKRIAWSYGRGFSPTRYIETFISNTFSRLVGLFLRSILICAGIVFEIVIFFLGGACYLTWIFLPAILFFCLLFGFKFLF
jgi:hypothetical protein